MNLKSESAGHLRTVSELMRALERGTFWSSADVLAGQSVRADEVPSFEGRKFDEVLIMLVVRL